MKNITLLLFSLFFAVSLSAQSKILTHQTKIFGANKGAEILDSTNSWDNLNHLTERELYFYDTKNNLVKQSGKYFNNYSQTIFTYDANNNQTSLLEQNWQDTSWQNYINILSFYDVNGNVIRSENHYYWNGSSDTAVSTYDANNNILSIETHSNSIWKGIKNVNGVKVIYTYDVNNNQTSQLTQNWDGKAWTNSSQTLFTYDGNNNLTGNLYQQWNGMLWISKFNTVNTYNPNNTIATSIFQDNGDTALVNYYYWTYTYNAKKDVTDQLMQAWNVNTWTNYYNTKHMYDSNNNLVYDLMQHWNGISWDSLETASYTYDNNKNLLSESGKTWNGSFWENRNQYFYTYDGNNYRTEQLSNGNKTDYYYRQITTGIKEIENPLLTIFPNPSNGSFTIKFNSTDKQLVNIFDINGRIVLSQQLVNNTLIDASSLCDGIYSIRISSNAEVENKRLVIIH